MGSKNDVRRSVEQIVPRGRDIYERRVRPELGQEDEDAFVVIDVESGDYDVAADEEEAFACVEARHQGAVFFFSRVGSGGEAVPATASAPVPTASVVVPRAGITVLTTPW